MKTNNVCVDNKGTGREAALGEVDSFCDSLALSSSEKLRLRLLAEEALGMTATISGEFNAEFWLEGDKTQCRLCLSASMKMTSEKRQALLGASTSGRNNAYCGVMDRVREEMEIYWLSIEEAAEDSTGVDYGVETLIGFDGKTDYKTPKDWKLSEYRGSVARQTDSERIAAWDELEKSIVANLADEITVGIRNSKVELVITKSIASA